VRRGELYRVRRPKDDPRRSRVFVVVGRRGIIESTFSTVICAPVFSLQHGLSTQVSVGVYEGLKHESAVSCDALMSVPKATLTEYVGMLGPSKLAELDRAVAIAVGLDEARG